MRSTKLVVAGALLMVGVLASPASAANNKGRVVHEAEAPRAALKALYAAVHGNATLARGIGAVSAKRIDDPAGTYSVRFNRNLATCFFMATIGLPGASGVETPGFITTVRNADDPKSIYVMTFNTAGAQADRSFFLHIGCP
jgi:hypothetical protein